MEIVSIINNKGGTGKTTTAVNLAVGLTELDYRVLLIDLDPQASATVSLGVPKQTVATSMADVLFDDAPLQKAIIQTETPGLLLAAGDMELANTDIILAEEPGRERLLRDALEQLDRNFHFAIIDCPPALSLLSVNALVASDSYLVPLAPEFLSYEGLLDLLEAIERIKKGIGIVPKMRGILFTLVNSTNRLSREYKAAVQIISRVREQFPELVFRRVIRRDVRVSEAPGQGQSVLEYAPDARGTKEYRLFAREFLERGGQKLNF